MKNNVIWQIFLINSCQLSPSKQIMQQIMLCSCATSFYSICFSIIKYCGYWNSQTLDRITDHANKLYREKLYGDNHRLTINNFPKTLQIYDADINIAFNLEKQGIQWCTSLGSKLLLQKLIKDNTKDNPGFLMWILNYWFGCIFQHNNMKTKAKSVKYYIYKIQSWWHTWYIWKNEWHRFSYSVISGYCKKTILE